MSIKETNESIGNRFRDIPAFSAVPQPTAPPHTPYKAVVFNVSYVLCYIYLSHLELEKNL